MDYSKIYEALHHVIVVNKEIKQKIQPEESLTIPGIDTLVNTQKLKTITKEN